MLLVRPVRNSQMDMKSVGVPLQAVMAGVAQMMIVFLFSFLSSD
jgi:hypothetical protein